jgi:hypothetical protein
MAVTNGWGRGIDNSNGWGQGAWLNSISWGQAESDSWSGDTLIYAPPFAQDQWQLIQQDWELWNTTWNS